MMRKKNLLCSGYHARLRAINPDFFPALSDVAADPRPGFDLEAELCSQVVGLFPQIKEHVCKIKLWKMLEKKES
jgi:hypothetical protein